MRLFRSRLVSEVPRLLDNNVRLTAIGRRDRLPLALADALGEAEEKTAKGTTLHMRLAIDYSARDEILRAAQRLAPRATRSRARSSAARSAASTTRAPRPMSISSSARAASAGSATSCSGSARTPSCISRT